MSITTEGRLVEGPLVFTPLYYERVWGGKRLETDLGRKLPPDAPVGESWELVDRPEAQSVVADGRLAGMTLHDLWKKHRREIFGTGAPDSPRFPLLGKILDARETLSVQVHPPASVAQALHGEPKTEMWYLLAADDEAAIYAGFRRGATKESFEMSLKNGTVEEMLHRIPVRAGDAMFVPSGRCHAIAAGCLIVELQQNSDTTYRVFDWNRTGLDGRPRALHIRESLASIDFDDQEPPLAAHLDDAPLVACDSFETSLWNLDAPRAEQDGIGVIYIVTEGGILVGGRQFARGDWLVLPACASERVLAPADGRASVLRCIMPPSA